MKPIRTSAKAVIIREGALLCIRKVDRNGVYHILPGGGQERGESLHDTLRRECQEEIAVPVDIGELRFVRDYIGRNHEFADVDSERHAMEMMFLCTLPEGAEPSSGAVPDVGQLGVAWVPLQELATARVYPIELSRALARGEGTWDSIPVYLGDIN